MNPSVISNYGQPAFDPRNTGRIYAVNTPVSGSSSIDVSNDAGTTWTQQFVIASGSNPVISHIGVDSSGNTYWGTSASLLRADPTGTVTSVVSWNPAGSDHRLLAAWAFAEGNDGYLYAASYTTTTTNNSAIYVSPTGGTGFVRKTWVIDNFPNNRHIHTLAADPNGDRVYALWGDTPTDGCQVAYSTDHFVSATQLSCSGVTTAGVSIPVPNQFTGMTFTSDGRAWLGTDRPNASVFNSVWVIDSGSDVIELAYLPTEWRESAPSIGKTACYSVRSHGDDELWTAWFDEGNGHGALIRLVKPSGTTGKWNASSGTTDWVERVILLDPKATADGGYRFISHDGKACSPANMPVFVDKLLSGSFYRFYTGSIVVEPNASGAFFYLVAGSASLAVSGTGQSGATVSVEIDATASMTAPVSGGSWVATGTLLTGTHVVRARQQVGVGPFSDYSNLVSVTGS